MSSSVQLAFFFQLYAAVIYVVYIELHVAVALNAECKGMLESDSCSSLMYFSVQGVLCWMEHSLLQIRT